MKKIVLSFFFLLSTMFLIAQDAEKQLAMQLVSKHSAAIGLSAEDLSNVIINSTYYNKFARTQMVYLQQSYQGLPVFNQMQVLAFKDGKLVSAAGERIKGIGKVSEYLSAAPSITPEAAVLTALSAKKLSTKQRLTATASRDNTTKVDYGKLAIALENVTAELMWVPLEDGKQIKLAWQVYLVPANSSDYFLIRVDANENKVIDESNLTVYCNFEPQSHEHITACLNEKTASVASVQAGQSPSLVGTANYLVIPFPAESPNHPNGAPALRTNPWTLAAGPATSLGWHNDGTTDYTITRGNNVHAQEDRDNSNNTLGLPATSTTTPDPLNFNFTPDFTLPPLQTTPVQNQQFNITNLFYWNNLVHDLTYLYGFDELAGNFQNSNQGRGGVGNDYVVADAQDAGGTNNANFSTPVDGQKPRMQMYLWNGSPQKDGDVDNGIIVHEYGHGISNRLTGGPATTSCLGNAEAMGEGWSDYYGLMYTQDWANSTITTGFTTPRGIGTYAMNQPPTGLGIRSQRYSTNFAINNKVYATSIPAQTHNRGEIWCATLWDMTWNIINQVGTINPNLFNPSAGGGNAIALRLVTEGLKLQPCNPGFISGRDAILQADQILYNGLYNCAIREAFRRRGMGDQASQGSSGSVTDQIPDFTGGVSLLLTQNGMQVQEGQNIVYTNTVNSSCAAISGYTLTDTLPANVTYVSGGSYNPLTRVVSFPVTQAAGIVQNYSFTVNVNTGAYFTPIILLSETVTGTSIPATWVTSATPAANVWTVSSLQSQSPPNSFFVENLDVAGDQRLEMTNTITLPAGSSPRLSFAHKFNTELGWDGGVVEISTNGGASWIDLGPNMISGGYNGTLGNAVTNPLANRSAFTGTINSFMNTTVNLTQYAGQNIKLRFRFGSDDNTAAPSGISGWFVDDILINVSPLVNMRSSLFNNLNARVAVSDTVTVIIPGVICTNAGITTQPANATACIGSNAIFTVTAVGTNNTYQWQQSTDGGTTWTNIPGAISISYTVPAVTAGMNNYRYRVVINNTCPSTVTSNGALLTVSSVASITAQPANTSVCVGSAATFTVTASGSTLSYQWQVSPDGITYTNIPGATNSTLTIPNVTAAMAGNRYRAVVFSCGPTGINSDPAVLSLIAPLIISTQPLNTSACVTATATFSVSATGPGLSYQWQVSINGGTSYTNIPGATSATLTVPNVLLTQNGYLYRAVITSTCSTVNSNAATLSINTPVSITSQPGNKAGCTGADVTFSVSAAGTSVTYQWQVSVNNGPWVNLTNNAPYSGVNTSSLTISGITEAMRGHKYRVIVSGIPCGEVISDPGSLLVYQRPGVVLIAAEYSNLTPGIPARLYTTVSPAGTYTYQWFRNGNILPNVTTFDYYLDVDRFGEYNVVVTDANGCSVTSNLVRVADSASNVVFIYPNPSNGQFQVRFFNGSNENRTRIITIYDSKGAKVYQNNYTGLAPYDRMDVDMRNKPAGIYMLELRDSKGERLATARVLIQ